MRLFLKMTLGQTNFIRNETENLVYFKLYEYIRIQHIYYTPINNDQIHHQVAKEKIAWALDK